MADETLIEKPSYDDVVSLITSKFGDKVAFQQSTKKNIKSINEKRRIFMTADRSIIQELAFFLRDKLNFEHCSAIAGVDWVDHMQTVYFITNYFNSITVEIKVDIPNDDLHVPTVATVWQGANWHERETYELFGIIFDGHPKLERLLTPSSYEFFPFRKSYKLRGQE
ncbi:MAG: NADH-quinone oxidoreductase subunit C [Candidatus Methanomethylophilaceae archaeon]|nr:NADH-quinone oxidoreductase subunit C [Candidatus Methanomethylophilaceae archaeon]MBR4202641.1 NADH-quinone oxidoreductase subunit C [Candidatus Methanomethylophilaceae archaeon]